MTAWPLVPLDDLCDRITVGHVGPMVDQYVQDGIPFLRSQNILPFRITTKNLKFIPQPFHHKLRKSALSPGDVAVVRTGYPGTAAVVPEWLADANCADLVVITPGSILDPFFLAAVFNSTWGIASVGGRLVGSAQQHFNVGAARRMELHVPPLRTQQKIASILSTYDDLIENNRRRIQVLEEMTRRIYREWFVDFHFPGHEAVALVDSEMGPIPQGWRLVPFTDLADILSGGTPRTTVEGYWNGDIPFFTPRDAPDTLVVTSTEKHVTQSGLDRCSSQHYPAGTVFITARGTVGKVAMAGVPMAMNQSCYAVRGLAGVRQEFVLFSLLNQVDYLRTNTGGATFDTIIIDTFRRMRTIAPSPEVIATFADVAEPIMQMIHNLQDAVSNIKATRNLLLPRLVSGEVDVSDLDIAMPEAAS